MLSQLERLEFKRWGLNVPVLEYQKMSRPGKAQKALLTDDLVKRHDTLTKPQGRTILACIDYSSRLGSCIGAKSRDSGAFLAEMFSTRLCM